jgi:hypothetical protein
MFPKGKTGVFDDDFSQYPVEPECEKSHHFRQSKNCFLMSS